MNLNLSLPLRKPHLQNCNADARTSYEPYILQKRSVQNLKAPLPMNKKKW